MDVRIARTQQEFVDHFMVRGEVFIIGQNIDWAIEFDGLDGECVLFTAYIDDKAVGAARLYQTKIGRLATLSEYRKRGVGTALMKAVEDYAKSQGLKQLKLHAQYYAKDFYENLGYKEVGEIFQEADIDHIKMIKEL
jgi:predicted GNAT family N-acyltransferase